jgi:hypothetical protein
MHGHGKYGYGHTGHGGMQIPVPLIPAPAALCALLVGLVIGIVIGRKKSTIHGMGPGMGHGMMQGMGPGMGSPMMHGMGSGMEPGGWMEGKRMMRGGKGHHHHGYGMPPCRCEGGSETDEEAGPALEDEGA